MDLITLNAEDGRGADWSVSSVESIKEVPSPCRNKLQAAARSVLTRTPYRVAKYASPKLREVVNETLAAKRYDVIWCHFWNSVEYVAGHRMCDDVKIVVDQHINDRRMWGLYCEQAESTVKKLYSCLNARWVESYQERVLEYIDEVVCVSELDANDVRERLGEDVQYRVAPNGVDVESFSPPEDENNRCCNNRIVFVGSMNIDMNIDAVLWFANEVFEYIRNETGAEFVVVGRDPADEVERLAERPGIEVTGTVDSVAEFYWRSDIAVVPFRYRASTKLKVPEALATETAVVATPEGIRGIAGEAGVHYCVADGSAEFSKKVIEMLKDDEKRRAISKRGRSLAENAYEWDNSYRTVFSEVAEDGS